MILEILISIFTNLVLGFLDLIDIVMIPVDLILVLRTFCVYGSYVVGSDLLLIFSSLVFVWTSAKLSVGLALRIWEYLPLT